MYFRQKHDRLQTHLLADESCKFIRADLSQSFKASDLRFASQLFHGCLLFCFVVTVDGLLLIPNAEQGGFQNVYMPVLNKVGEELQEEGHQQQAVPGGWHSDGRHHLAQDPAPE